jgi:hypothetical protein
LQFAVSGGVYISVHSIPARCSTAGPLSRAVDRSFSSAAKHDTTSSLRAAAKVDLIRKPLICCEEDSLSKLADAVYSVSSLSSSACATCLSSVQLNQFVLQRCVKPSVLRPVNHVDLPLISAQLTARSKLRISTILRFPSYGHNLWESLHIPYRLFSLSQYDPAYSSITSCYQLPRQSLSS